MAEDVVKEATIEALKMAVLKRLHHIVADSSKDTYKRLKKRKNSQEENSRRKRI